MKKLALVACTLLLATTLVLADDDEKPAETPADKAASEAATKLLASNAFASAKVADHWVGSYAGSCWTGALHVTVVEKDAAQQGLRRFDVERITSNDKEHPARELQSWWVDASGAIVKGERAGYEAGADTPKFSVHYELKGGKISARVGDKPENVLRDLPPAFMPDKVLALVLVPDQKGGRWRFGTIANEKEFGFFTIEDLGPDKVQGRSGEVTARKLKVIDPDDEAVYWVDDQHRIVTARWPSLPNLTSVLGSEEEARSDWWKRPADEFDTAGDKFIAGAGKLEASLGELTYGVYTDEGELKERTTAKLTKEEKDGKPAFHYVSTVAAVSSESSSAVEEWWFAADGKVLSGRYAFLEGGKEGSVFSLRVEGDKMISSVSDAPAGKEEMTFPVPPRMVPDSFLYLKAASREKTSCRLHGFDLVGRFIYSILITPKSVEEVNVPSGKVQARRLDLAQNVAEAHVWVDTEGKPLLVSWHYDDLNVFAPLDKLPKKIEGTIGPAGGE